MGTGIELEMEVKACLFDLDGVLVDTAVYHYDAWKRLSAMLGFDLGHEQNEQLKGISRMDSLEKILGWGGLQKSDTEKLELATLKNGWYVDMIGRMTEADVLPGAIDFLEELRRAGIKIGLGSASRNAGLILERTGLAGYIDEIVDGNVVGSSKPDPAVFLKGAELVNEANEHCVVFEDAVAGVEAARAAGMRVVGIGSPEVLQADLVISGLHEMNLEKLKTV